MKLDAIWQVEGILTTVSPLHVGDGRARLRPFQRPGGEADEQAEVQCAAKTWDGRGRIPGSSLKGVVRGGFGDADEEIFGVKEKGGLAVFLDAYTDELLPWEKLVLGRTAIDAVTGAAGEHLLFHAEFVPPGTEFRVRIRGKAFDGGTTWQDAAATLDEGMGRFGDGTIRLGAGEANGKGICTWRLDAVRVMDGAARREWLEAPAPLDGILGKLRDRKSEIPPRSAATREPRKTLQLRLRFDGHPFLVNDPCKVGTKEQGRRAHAARRTADGKLLLPAESFRGVLAHQAARIARTRKKNGERQEVRRGADGRLPQNLDAVTRLFGAPGWSSVIDVRDFAEAKQPERRERAYPDIQRVQQFLAVDRFTGGGAEERKFDAEGGWSPVLEGAISFDLRRLRLTGDAAPSLGLLALTLRDLAEGDCSFGWGSGKGYGWATVDTRGATAVQWVERELAGWCEGRVVDWISAWEREGVSHG